MKSDGGFSVDMAVSVEPDLSTLVRGVWCPVCLLPSAVSVHFDRVTLTSEGALVEPIGQATWCYDHRGALEWPAHRR